MPAALRTACPLSDWRSRIRTQYNGNGTLDATELAAALKKLGCKTSLAELDTDGDGVISFEEFAVLSTVLERHSHIVFKQPAMSKCKDLASTDAELVRKAKETCARLVSTMRVDDTTLFKEFQKLDGDHDGRLTKQEMKDVRALHTTAHLLTRGPADVRAHSTASGAPVRNAQIVKTHVSTATMAEQQLMVFTIFSVGDVNRDDSISFDEFKAIMQASIPPAE